jgi:hypothetical protein
MFFMSSSFTSLIFYFEAALNFASLLSEFWLVMAYSPRSKSAPPPKAANGIDEELDC